MAIFGLAADTALCFDVVTVEGKFITADSKKNPDLFYGLKGGGPGNYGIVVSATFKTFAEQPSGGAQLYINSTLTTLSTLCLYVRVLLRRAREHTRASLCRV